MPRAARGGAMRDYSRVTERGLDAKLRENGEETWEAGRVPKN